MKQLILIMNPVLVLLLTATAMRAQDIEVEVRGSAGESGDSATAVVKAAEDFSAPLVSMQFPLTWDETNIEYDSIGDFNSQMAISTSNFGISEVDSGLLRFVWVDGSFTGRALSQGDTLFSITYRLIGDPGGGSTVDFADTPIESRATVLPFTDAGFTGSSGVMDIKESPLPIRLIHFTAESAQGPGYNTEFSWETATEVNNRGFSIEMQRGEQWLSIGSIESKGASNQVQEYSYKTWVEEAGQLYFRLKQTDYDGKSSYSKVVSINLDHGGKGVLRVSRTLGGEVRLYGIEGAKSIRVVSLGGRLLKRLQLSGGRYATLPRHLKAGVYLCRVEYPYSVKSIKVPIP